MKARTAGPALFFLCASAAYASPAERLVPGDYPSITAALRDSLPGDIIRVRGGVHPGNLVLVLPVRLEGEQGAIIRGEGKGAVVVLSGGSTLAGFRLERSGDSLADADAGIRLTGSGNLVAGNTIAGCLFGVYLDRSSGNTLRGNTIEGREEIEIGERGSGIHLFDSHQNLIEGNRVNAARDGIYFDHSHRNVVRQSSFRRSRYGLHYMYSDGNTFQDNLFSDCTAGSAIMFSRGLVFEGNRFIRNRGFSAVGALLKDCYGSRAERNLFADNSTGLLLDNSMENAFRRNIVLRNDTALCLFTSSDNNLFTENNFLGNLSPIRLVGKRSSTRWQEVGRGNYWSEYHGYDLDGDGVGDVPHRIQNVFEFLESEHPPLRLFLVSPAAAALRAGEEAFPLFEFSCEVDRAPLARPVEIEVPAGWLAERKRGPALPAAAAFGLAAGGMGAFAFARRWRRGWR